MVIDRLNAMVTDLEKSKDAAKSAETWRNAHALLKKTNADQLKAGRVVAERSVAGLKALLDSGISELQRMAGLSRPMTAGSAPAPSTTINTPIGSTTLKPASGVQLKPAAPPSEDELKSALKAFRKRLKVTQLDAESRLSNRALTGGRREEIVAIQPPNSHPLSVWEHLAQTGKLKRAGSGLYQLIEG